MAEQPSRRQDVVASPALRANDSGRLLARRYRVDGRPVVRPGVVSLEVWDQGVGLPRELWLLRPERQDASSRELFLASGRGQLQLAHPGLVRVVDLLDDGREVGWVLESRPLRPLTELQLDLQEIVRLAREGLDTLAHLHEQGVVHGGLEIDALGIDERGCLKLPPPVVDPVAHGQPVDALGTRPPEVKGDPRLWTPAADVFAWGAVIYELLTGSPVGDLSSAWQPARLGGAMPTWLRDVLMVALAPRPQDRYGTAKGMEAALRRGGPVEVLGQAEADEEPSWFRRGLLVLLPGRQG